MAKASRDEWAKRVERWQDSGLTAKEFAAELNVSPNSLTFWKWKLRQPTDKSSIKAAPDAVRVDSTAAMKFLQLVPAQTPVETAAVLELVLSNGVTLRVPKHFRRSHAATCDECTRGAPMIPATTPIFVCTTPVDMRCSFVRLERCTREVLQQDPSSGALFIFAGKRGTSLKALWWDKSGFCILYKRLSRGYFRLPAAIGGETSVRIEPRELALILEGIALPKRKRVTKTIRTEARKKALHAIATVDTDDRA